VENVKKFFDTQQGIVRAVDGVSFGVKKGETFGLIGESGSGKSTLAYVVSGIYLPTEGNIFFEKKTNNKLLIDFCFTFNKNDLGVRHKKQFFAMYSISNSVYDLLTEKQLQVKNPEFQLNYKIELKGIQRDEESVMVNPLSLEHLTIKLDVKSDKEIIEGLKVNIDLRNPNKKYPYLIKCKNLPYKIFDTQKRKIMNDEVWANIRFTNLLPELILYKQRKANHDETAQNYNIDRIFPKISSIFQVMFSKYSYIGPLRAEPYRRYFYENDVVEIGNKGENAAYLYFAEKDNLIKDHYFLKEDKIDYFVKKPYLSLEKSLDYWLKLMNIKNLKPETSNEVMYLNLNSNLSSTTTISIADTGFGVSQIFPIALEGLRMSTGDTLILEQPEIHLHPNLQMQLADYFIALALSNKKVIVETHSDHIINRLVRRIVEDNKFNLKDKIAIYFIKMAKNGAKYEEISINDSFGITNWPKDFFDQTAIEQEEIIRAGLKKRKSQSK